MRRKEREVTDKEEIRQILEKGQVIRIAMNNGEYPYILPVNYGYEMENGRITLFFHGAKEGTKYEILKKDAHVSVETDCEHCFIPPTGEEGCTASYAYASVIGQGIASEVSGVEKENALIHILEHYGVKQPKMNPAYVEKTRVFKIEIEKYTAKHRR